MQARPAAGGRINSYHGAKRQLVGNTAGRAAPAWRTNNYPNGVPNGPAPRQPSGQTPNGTTRNATPSDPGSKILLSNLPNDVKEAEIMDLMKKTIGPLKETFMIYNSQALSKGMAVVSFQRAADAKRARDMYHGKVIDRRRAIKIEIVVDSDVSPTPAPATPTRPKQKSLFDRIGAFASQSSGSPQTQNPAQLPQATRPSERRPHVPTVHAAQQRQPRPRLKKGPRRIKKSAEQLDKEMEEYRAQVAADMTE